LLLRGKSFASDFNSTLASGPITQETSKRRALQRIELKTLEHCGDLDLEALANSTIKARES